MLDMKVVHLAREGFCPVSPEGPFPLRENRVSMGPEALVDDCFLQWQKADVFLIDACFSTGGIPACSFGGITLLKLIRMKGLRQHAIVYSPLPLSFLLRQGYHEILMSGGTSYEWLPVEISEAMCRERMGRIAEEDLSVFFLPEYNALLRMERHSLANWWGVLRLHHAMDALGMLLGDAPDFQMREALERERNSHGRLMSYVRFRGRVPAVTFAPRETDSLLTRIGLIRRRNLKVVYVDDQAADGWSFLLQWLLYGRLCPERFITPVVSPSSLDMASLIRTIRAEAPDLVVMDIRLSDDDRGPRPSGLEAIRQLSKDGDEIGCPILAFTASDKREISEKAILLGADAVWTKEGIDEAESLVGEEYVRFTKARFDRLIAVLGSFIMEERLLLWDFLKSVRDIETAPEKFWWERSCWFPGDTASHRRIPKAVVTDRLRNVYLTQKQALTNLWGRPDRKLYEKLIVELAWILEVVHADPQGGKGDMRSLGSLTENVWPEGSEPFGLVRDLIRKRNTVVHADMAEGRARGFDGYRTFLSLLMRYLTTDTSGLAARGTPNGVLVRSADTPGKYCLLSEDGTAFRVRREDSCICEKMLEDCAEKHGVEASLRPPVARYDFFDMKAAGDAPPASGWWSMKVSRVWESRHIVQVKTKSIQPRRDAMFRVTDADTPALRPDMKVYFHVFFSGNPEGAADLRIFDVIDGKPKMMQKTFWSGIVDRVEYTEDSCLVGLKVVFPPKHWSFIVPMSIWEEMDDTDYGLLFHPDWEQTPSVSGLRMADGGEE